MDTFPPGTRVIFYEGDRAQSGVVKAIETVEARYTRRSLRLILNECCAEHAGCRDQGGWLQSNRQNTNQCSHKRRLKVRPKILPTYGHNQDTGM